jgi:hypothetical protein
MSFDVNDLLANLYPQLHAASDSDLVFWSKNELVRYMADAQKRFVQKYGVRVVRDTSTVELQQGIATYAAPPRHLSTIHVALDGRALRASSVSEITRRDRQYQATESTATSPIRWWYTDSIKQNRIGFYPIPGAVDNGKSVEIIYHQYLCGPHIDLSDAVIDAPLWFGDYMELSALAEAYGREGDGQMVETSQAIKQILALYEMCAERYWGKAE